MLIGTPVNDALCDPLIANCHFAQTIFYSMLGSLRQGILLDRTLASVHKYLRICDLCKELGNFVYTRTLQWSGSGKPRPTLVWCLCAR